MRLRELLLKLVGNKETVERSGKQLFTCTSPELVNAHKTRAEENRAATVGLSGLPNLSPSKFPTRETRSQKLNLSAVQVTLLGSPQTRKSQPREVLHFISTTM